MCVCVRAFERGEGKRVKGKGKTSGLVDEWSFAKTVGRLRYGPARSGSAAAAGRCELAKP